MLRPTRTPTLLPLAPPQVSISTDPYAVFKGAEWALMIGAKPRGPGQERADLLDQNGRIFVEQVRHAGCSVASHTAGCVSHTHTHVRRQQDALSVSRATPLPLPQLLAASPPPPRSLPTLSSCAAHSPVVSMTLRINHRRAVR